jgi:hypothetical protein
MSLPASELSTDLPRSLFNVVKFTLAFMGSVPWAQQSKLTQFEVQLKAASKSFRVSLFLRYFTSLLHRVCLGVGIYSYFIFLYG